VAEDRAREVEFHQVPHDPAGQSGDEFVPGCPDFNGIVLAKRPPEASIAHDEGDGGHSELS